MSRKRFAWIAAASLGGLLVLAVLAAVLVVRSPWFYEQVRLRVVSTVETATGGRVEAGSFQFDWKRLRAEVKSFALHGTEPAGKLPLFRASSVAVGLRIVSLLKRDVDIQYLDVADPHIYLIVDPDGHTNIPEPKIKSRDQRGPVETILNLAIGRFQIQNGVFEVEARGATPFDGQGRNLNARFLYEPAGPRYRGEIAIDPVEVRRMGEAPVPIGVNLAVTMEKNRIGITRAKLTTGGSRVEFSGAVDDLASPRGSFQYTAHVSVADVSRILHVGELERGSVETAGNAAWSAASGFSATGNLHAYGLDYRDSSITLRGCQADGALAANADGIDLNGLRFSGNYVSRLARVPAGGQVTKVALHNRELDLHGVAVAALGGTFQGQARLREFKYYLVEGDVAGFEARRVVALYSSEPLPWDARASGAVRVEGTLGSKQDLRATAHLDIAPATAGAPVRGQISAAYEARGETLDLGNSTLSLPSSRLDFSGVLVREMRVHLETRDLNDLLPALGESAAAFPVKLDNGSAVFDGSVTGRPDSAQIAGHLRATRVSYSGTTFDSVEANVTASPDNIKLRDAAVTHGRLRAELQADIAPRAWKIGDDSPVSAAGAVHNADVAELAAVLGATDLPVTGTLGGTAQLTGTVAKPIVAGDIELTKGSFQDEPFDRITAHVGYESRSLRLQSGQLTAGPIQLQLAATFDHAADRFDQGRIHFQVASNAMPLEAIKTLQKARPGVKGTVHLAGNGDLDLAPSSASSPAVRVADLHADVAARGLQLTGQTLGDASIAVNSQGQVLRAHLESDFANSNVRGDGEWRLDGDYPGSATVTFSRLDFAQLRAWIMPSQTGTPDPFSGFAEGELRVQGPVLKPALMKAELRIPKMEIGPPRSSNGRTAAATAELTLHNSGPLVATMANSVITVESAHLAGTATDFTIGGKVLVDQKNPLDLRANGRIDLSILRYLDPDFVSSGTVAAEATVRGPFDSPQVNGRLQLQNAAFNINDLPNGISGASGVILLNGSRATIQSFSGETGGGKIELSGFASYSGDLAVFQLRATARQVRVRYPEGVSTVADADLNLTGTTERSVLSGSVTILRTGFNPQSDFSSLIARSAEPVRTPSARTGVLGGLNFDVQVNTAPDIQFQSSLTQDLQVDANLQLRGNVSNPAVIGRITITQGQLVFYGTKYNINQGSIAFYNPVKIDPILDIDLETKARGIDVTLSVTGPLNKPKLTPRSDPPLQFQEIVALLATGRTPTSDPTLLAQQSTAPQSWQQMGASALLGQAIANPVAGRLQRFFGVSKLRIDPTLPGVENNPQARLTLEQQITPDITFTYITNVTTTNPQVVRVEWNVTKQWSIVLLRDENGTLGADFFVKKRF